MTLLKDQGSEKKSFPNILDNAYANDVLQNTLKSQLFFIKWFNMWW